MKTQAICSASLAMLAASLLLAGCGGGNGDPKAAPTAGPASPSTGSGNDPPPTTPATTPGVWKGTISSTTTGLSSPVVVLTAYDGHSVWMTADGRTWNGQLPPHGDYFDSTFSGHRYDGEQFPDGTYQGTTSMMVDHHTTGATSGHYSGNGDAGTFHMSLSPMWDRPAALTAVAGVYTRTTSTGYAMTMSIGADGQFTASDSRGCLINGTVTVPDAAHNMYGLDGTVSACGSLDGHYQGQGTLLDADAMQDWMTAMHPLEQGGHSHGGSMMGGSNMMGHNTVPGGQRNLFMFALVNDTNALMDAVAR